MSNFVKLQFGNVLWRVREDLAHVLFDACGLRLRNWLETGQASVVKHGPHRTVYRVRLDDRSLYVKHYRVADARAMLSQWAQASKGRREWNRVRELAGKAIPTMVPLALGEELKAGLVLENYLVTEAIEDVEPLDSFIEHVFPSLPERQQPRVRRHLADGLAELTAKLHESGVVHPDLHAGNVLVRLRDRDAVELFVIDLHEARLAHRVSWRRSRTNLLRFGMYFLEQARGADRLRFLRRYLELRPALGIQWPAVAGELYRDLLRTARWFWRRLDDRCVSNNRRFFYRNIGCAHGFAVTELGEERLLTLLRDPDAPLESAQATVLKDSSSSTVARLELPLQGVSTPAIYKRFCCPKWLDPLRAMLHHSPALRAWHAGHGLLVRSIPTPRPLAVIERVRGPLVCENYILLQAVPSALNLDQYLRQVVAVQRVDQQWRAVRPLVRQLGRLVRKMHERNISHRDMKGVNFLITPGRVASDPLQLQLIDLAAVQIWRRLPDARRMQNLARILVSLQGCQAVTRTDYLRFLLAYRIGDLHVHKAWKHLWRELAGRAQRKVARNRRLSRPVT